MCVPSRDARTCVLGNQHAAFQLWPSSRLHGAQAELQSTAATMKRVIMELLSHYRHKGMEDASRIETEHKFILKD